MKVIKALTNSAVLALGMRTTIAAPRDVIEFCGTHLLVNGTVVVPMHRVTEMVVEKAIPADVATLSEADASKAKKTK